MIFLSDGSFVAEKMKGKGKEKVIFEPFLFFFLMKLTTSTFSLSLFGC